MLHAKTKVSETVTFSGAGSLTQVQSPLPRDQSRKTVPSALRIGPGQSGWGLFVRAYCRLAMKSSIIKHSIVIAGRKTSVSLERTFWDSLREIAMERNEALSKLVEAIDAYRQSSNLSSAIRITIAIGEAPARDQLEPGSSSPAERSGADLGGWEQRSAPNP